MYRTGVNRRRRVPAPTTKEVVARLNKNWNEDAIAFDAVSDHILHISDSLSDRIVKQYPEKFERGAVSTTGIR